MIKQEVIDTMEDVCVDVGLVMPEVRFATLGGPRAYCGVTLRGLSFVTFDIGYVISSGSKHVLRSCRHEALHLKKRHPQIRFLAVMTIFAAFAVAAVRESVELALLGVAAYALFRWGLIPLQEISIRRTMKKRGWA